MNCVVFSSRSTVCEVVAIVIQVMEFLYQFIDEIEYLWK